VLIKRSEDERSKLLVASSRPVETQGGVAPTLPRVNVTDEDFFGATTPGTTGFTPGIGGPIDLDERPAGASPTPGSTGVVIPLSRMFFHGDAVAICKTFAEGTFDAVITDWPYGIDMDNIQQNGGGKDVSTTATEHGVDANLALQKAIIPELFRILKPNGWFITWTDIMQWQRNYDLCIAAGFKVQRWPLTWHKTSVCINQSAQYNFTKNYEIAMVCRKDSATLISPQGSSVWTGGNDVEARALGHPFAKPFQLWDWIFNACVVRGASILEPFAGRGSAVIPAIKRGLRVTAIECNDAHYDALVVNVSQLYKSLDPTVKFE